MLQGVEKKSNCEKKIKDVISVLQNEYLNPFVIPDLDLDELFNLSSGVPLQAGIEELLNIWNRGKELAQEFWFDGLLSTKKPFQDPIKQVKVPMFDQSAVPKEKPEGLKVIKIVTPSVGFYHYPQI